MPFTLESITLSLDIPPIQEYQHLIGLHLEQRRNHFDHETQALMKSQDLGYIQFQKSINAKKLEKLKSGLHFVDDNDHVQETRHTIFVDSDQKVRDFDAVEHFDTVPEMINRPSNRMKKSTLESVDLGAEYDTKTLKVFNYTTITSNTNH